MSPILLSAPCDVCSLFQSIDPSMGYGVSKSGRVADRSLQYTTLPLMGDSHRHSGEKYLHFQFWPLLVPAAKYLRLSGL